MASLSLGSDMTRLVSRNSDERAQALSEIGAMSPGEKQVLAQSLLAEFQNRDAVVANWAGEALVEMKGLAVPLVAEYLRSAQGPMPPAIDVLARLPVEAKAEIDWLLEGLSERDLRAGFAVLSKMGAWRAGGFAGKVARHLNHPDRWARESAAYTLGRMGTSASAYANQLALSLDDPELTVRNAAAGALSLVKPNDPEISRMIAEKLSQGRDGLSHDVGVGALKDRQDEAAGEALKDFGHSQPSVEKYDTRKPSEDRFRTRTPTSRKFQTRRSGQHRFNTRKSFRQRALERSREE